VIRDAIKQAMDLDLANLPKFGATTLAGVLAKQLLDIAPGNLDKVYFCNSGTEGVETAMKYARSATNRERFVYCEKAYHGLTYGALSINGGDEFREGFGKLLDDVTRIPFNDLTALEQELAKEDVAGFIVEPIQGKGVVVPDDDYLPGAAELCRKHGTIFVADEVQTGFGRTGRMFACEHWGVEPDILVVSKALSGGYVPVAAVMSKEWIHKSVFSEMDKCMVHSTTFTQNDLSMTAGLATLHVLREEKIVENSAAMGELLLSKLSEFVEEFDFVKEVRGKGLMIVIEFGAPKNMALKMGWKMLAPMNLFPQAVLIPLLKEHHVLAQVAGHHQDNIKLLPPLVLSEQDVNDLVDALRAAIAPCHKFPGPVWEVGKQLGRYSIGR
jgi:ornithine--oxo-acid transaminase